MLLWAWKPCRYYDDSVLARSHGYHKVFVNNDVWSKQMFGYTSLVQLRWYNVAHTNLGEFHLVHALSSVPM